VSALLRRLRHEDEGMSLAELIVTMFVTGILLAIVGSMFINVSRVTASSNASNQRANIAANVMEGITEVIRSAANNSIAGSEDPDPAIVAGTATGLTVYSYSDTVPSLPAPTKVTYRVDASGNLIEDRYASSASGGYWVFATTATSRMLGGPVSLTGADPLFAYLDSDNKVVTPPSGGLTLEQRTSIASIRVTVRIENTTTNVSTPIVVQNTVGMPNLNFARTDN
jgi:Tfp pilus assembly protein PilW